ncbi:uncharacterized protein LOC135348079 isoform X3 [Halichondria panicea]|uniref:uncharacterized protein LOC135348079 isoform X3 n=1 Tax=Halichondria panicea TaxID=6063 RepID=UPI00312B7F8F
MRSSHVLTGRRSSPSLHLRCLRMETNSLNRFCLPGLGKRCSPLRDRVFSFDSDPMRTPQYKKVRACRPEKYRPWSKRSMERALDAVIHKGVAVSRAAADYGIPKTTLYDNATGRVLPGSRSGPKTYFTVEEEALLVCFLIKSAEIGYPFTRLQVLSLVETMLIRKNKEKTGASSVTHGWWARFCKRHPEVSLKTSSCLSVARVKASSAETLSEYFCGATNKALRNKTGSSRGRVKRGGGSGVNTRARVTNPPDLNTRDGHEAYTVSSPADSASTDVEGDKGGATNKALRNKAGSFCGRAKRGRGSGATTRARVTNPSDLNTRDGLEAYTVSFPADLASMDVEQNKGGATNKALRNKTGSSRGKAKRGRGRSSGVNTRARVTNPPDLNTRDGLEAYTVSSPADSASSASTDVEDDKGGATNKALRNKTGSSRGRAKRRRGRSSGATTRARVTNPPDLNTRDGLEAYTVSSPADSASMDVEQNKGGVTNKALRNKTGSSRGRAKRGRGRGGSSGATTRARVTNPPDLNTRDGHEAYTVSSPGQLKCMYVWLCACVLTTPQLIQQVQQARMLKRIKVLQTRSSGIRQVLPAAEQNVDVENYKVLMIIFMC